MEAHCGAVEAFTGTVEAHMKHCRLSLEPRRLAIKPWLANPGAAEVQLRGVESHPGVLKAHLGVLKAWPGAILLCQGIVPKVFTEIKLSESFSSKDVFTSALRFNSQKLSSTFIWKYISQFR
jgi:hypothetical protein